MLGMGPLILRQIVRYQKAPASRDKAAQPGYPFSHRYYLAIDAINRGERLVCTCDGRIPRHDVTGKLFTYSSKAFP